MHNSILITLLSFSVSNCRFSPFVLFGDTVIVFYLSIHLSTPTLSRISILDAKRTISSRVTPTFRRFSSSYSFSSVIPSVPSTSANSFSLFSFSFRFDAVATFQSKCSRSNSSGVYT